MTPCPKCNAMSYETPCAYPSDCPIGHDKVLGKEKGLTIEITKVDNGFPGGVLSVGMAYWNPRNLRGGHYGGQKRKMRKIVTRRGK